MRDKTLDCSYEFLWPTLKTLHYSLYYSLCYFGTFSNPLVNSLERLGSKVWYLTLWNSPQFQVPKESKDDFYFFVFDDLWLVCSSWWSISEHEIWPESTFSSRQLPRSFSNFCRTWTILGYVKMIPLRKWRC